MLFCGSAFSVPASALIDMITQIALFLMKMTALWTIIVNHHKKSRIFLYSFNTLIFSKRYCVLFLYQYNKDTKEK